MNAGKGLHIVVNANAKRGGRRIAVQIAAAAQTGLFGVETFGSVGR